MPLDPDTPLRPEQKVKMSRRTFSSEVAAAKQVHAASAAVDAGVQALIDGQTEIAYEFSGGRQFRARKP